LLSERLQAWKHAVSYLEDYMAAMEKIHKSQSKEYEKALKVRCPTLEWVSPAEQGKLGDL
jgi:hypothetical protein